MEILNSIFEYLKEYIPSAIGIVIVIVVLSVTRLILDKRFADKPGYRFRRQVITICILFIGLIIIILIAPFSDSQRGQLFSLIGILITAVIALSSATLVGNAMAGIMLRAVRNFKAGDFITVGDYFGRISERGLFHIEIQNEERDLVTLPNIYVASNPVEVIRSSGTIISASVSLGYDIPRSKIKKLLLEAAGQAELSEPFVHVKELGDYSVKYLVAGLLEDPKHIISGRSRLKGKVLDVLHEGGVEIVSPTFMNTRDFSDGKRFIPVSEPSKAENTDSEPEVEEVAFDKADEAESLENLKEKLEQISQEVSEVESELKGSPGPDAEVQLKKRLTRLKKRYEYVSDLLNAKESDG
ncbi:MAG: mechanosensitive ion channel family protein [candidate division Zixibacteria bacterium]|nr:mechanosensitive ion channel family protein [candidate division Zixibacteria bacterium]